MQAFFTQQNRAYRSNISDKLEKRCSAYKRGDTLVVSNPTTKSAYQIVGYGNPRVPFDNVLLTRKILDPGDSGSSIYIEFD
jgi:hypothetical protein